MWLKTGQEVRVKGWSDREMEKKVKEVIAPNQDCISSSLTMCNPHLSPPSLPHFLFNFLPPLCFYPLCLRLVRLIGQSPWVWSARARPALRPWRMEGDRLPFTAHTRALTHTHAHSQQAFRGLYQQISISNTFLWTKEKRSVQDTEDGVRTEDLLTEKSAGKKTKKQQIQNKRPLIFFTCWSIIRRYAVNGHE